MKYHLNAKTNVHIRSKIHTLKGTNKEIAELYGIHPNTVSKWRNRKDFADRSHATKNHRYALTEVEKHLFIAYRRECFEGIDDVVEAMEERLQKRFCRTTVYNLFRKEGINRVPRTKEAIKKFKYYPKGYLHIDVTEIPIIEQKNKKQFLYVAIDRQTRYMFYKIYDRQTQFNTLDFVTKCYYFFPFKINYILTDNGREFTNKGLKHRGVSKDNVKNSLLTSFCLAVGIEHRLTKPYSPKTNGMVERANQKIKRATIHGKTYKNNDQLINDLDAFLIHYNTKKRHSGLVKELGVKTPVEALKKLAA